MLVSGEAPSLSEPFLVEKNLLIFTQKPRAKSRTLYRVAAIGLAALITQASPGGAASSWGAECLATDVGTNSYCVDSDLDLSTSKSGDMWTLRKSVETANLSALPSATIGFKDALFGGNNEPAKIVLNSTLEIKTNITITAPTDADGRILLTIERGTEIELGAPLITVNPTTESGVNKATTEVKIENVIIDSRANPEISQDASAAIATPGVAIQVNPVEASIDETSDTRTPTLVIKSVQIINSVSETGGAAINSSGDVRVENSSLTGNLATTPSGGSPTDGGAIKSEGTVTIIGSNVSNNSATGSGGAISAQIVEITTDSSIYANSQLNDNSSGGDGGAISAAVVSASQGTTFLINSAGGSGGAIAAAVVTVEYTAFLANTAGELAGGGNGGAISAESVTVNSSSFSNNEAYQGDAFEGNGGAIAAQETVTVNTSIFDDNYSDSAGGAIYSQGDVVITSNFDKSNQAVTPGIDEVLERTSFIDNASDVLGGAIAAIGTGSSVQIENSVFESNSATRAGGAIYFEGNLDVGGNSEFTMNFATQEPFSYFARSECALPEQVNRQTCAEELFMFLSEDPPYSWGFDLPSTGGGAIFGQDLSYGPDAPADEAHISTATIQDSTFSKNSADGDGGAIFYWGLLQILRTRFEQNWALPAEFSPDPFSIDPISVGSGGAIFGMNIEVTASTFVENIAALDGGAIRAIGQLDIFGPELPSNTTQTNQFTFNVAVADQNWNDGDWGNGGAISAAGPVSVADSFFTGNSATSYGGAIYTPSALHVRDSVFGTLPEVNPLFNPVIGTIPNENYSPEEFKLNPNFNPMIEVQNPNYNPLIDIPNPNFNPIIQALNPNFDTDVPRLLTNPNFNTEVPPLIPNPGCPENSTVYNGDYSLFLCEWIVPEAGGSQHYETLNHIQNPLYDDREFIQNPLYDNRVFVDVLQNPLLPSDDREFIQQLENPNLDEDVNEFITQLRDLGHPLDDREFISNDLFDPRADLPVLQFPDNPQNDYKFNYLGNQSGSRGGAIYVRGPAIIENTNFSGNSSGLSGGAIGSYGSLNIMDSQFVRNLADGSGGAIYVAPSDSDTVLMARNSFIENISDSVGGAINIDREISNELPVDTIMASLFQRNEAVYAGGAISSTSTTLVLNTFEDNKALEGDSLEVIHGILLANVFLGSLSSSSLCSNLGSTEVFNYSTDSSCFNVDPVTNPTSTNHLLVRGDKMLSTDLIIENDFRDQAFGEGAQLILNPATPYEVATNFLISEIQKDFNSDIRAPSVPWTAGHLQLFFPVTPVKPSAPVVSADDTANVIDSLDLTTMEYAIGSDEYTQAANPDLSGDKTVHVRIKDDGVNGAGWEITLTFTANKVSLEAPKTVSITPTSIVQSVLPFARPEALVSEYALSADDVAQTEKRNAALLSAKEARSKARASAAEKRRVQLEAFSRKIVATKARGEALKQKSSWINLMKDFQKL